jgi:hypothetical protein
MAIVLVRALIGAVFVAASALPTLSAPDVDDLCVQAFLDFKGFDVGPLDGAAGKKTFAAAAAFKAANGVEIADLGPDNSAEWCALAKADAVYAVLLEYEDSSGQLWNRGVTSSSNPDQVLLADSVGQYSIAKRSITTPGALGFVPLEDGLAAARVKVTYADEGHREDWFYNDEPGRQQRFELVEKSDFWMKTGQTYWSRMSVFVPKGFFVAPLDKVTLSDIKPETWGQIILDPVVDFALNAGALQLMHFVGRKLDCIIVANEGGGDNTLCDVSMEQNEVLRMPQVWGKWTNIVYRVHWADDETGRLHLWVNDKFIAGFAGNTAHGGTSFQSKFGVYRGYYGSQPKPQPDARIYFSGVGRSDTCEGLGIPNCAALEADVETIDTPGVTNVNIVEFQDKTDHLEAGGKIKCDLRQCYF